MEHVMDLEFRVRGREKPQEGRHHRRSEGLMRDFAMMSTEVLIIQFFVMNVVMCAWEAKGVKYHIRLSNPRPFRERSRHIPLAEMAEIRRHLQELMDHRIIIESKSPYASRIVIVWKKNGQLRMRIDYRTLNTWPIIDQYTVPQLQEALDCFS
ncbi:hypothetical protein Y1Q_0023049 [Alligator mississippiensis]|uniref:Uncharacterized protein n=1 Tax=Alligator mississippiensis TaxID=8496 RepID=A0A151P0U8_ALLMI|nr:hypothetical protein Y1Q_0023049 [Alligator mississippiensis]